MPSISNLTSTGFYFSSILFLFSGFLLLAIYKIRWKSDWISLAFWLLAFTFSGFAAWLITSNFLDVIIAMGINLFLALIFYKLLPITSLFGLFFFTSMLAPALYAIIWFNELIQMIFAEKTWAFSILLLLGSAIFSALILINTIMLSWIVLARYSILYFRFPRIYPGLDQSRSIKEISPSHKFTPYVSIHLPCCNEPPEVVIETLNSIANLKYPHFEVIVFDNNTKDPNIWKPVQEHCAKLGERFRFFHLDNLAGAKAGALNACLKLTSSQAELISVMDADYITKDNFLAELVGFFEDPQVGFVQTCQDYRDWQNRIFQTACYYEYETHFKLELLGQNEWDINYTIGTMCLIRRSALEEVKGWAEWCLTEDSEVAVRIHALGYEGFYLNQTFGHGLIPETFEGYKQQRFRWSAGPVQQFMKHWRLYLPWTSHGKLTFMQKFGEILHSLSVFFSEGLNFFINIPILAIGLWLLLAKGQRFTLSNVVLWMIPLFFLRNVLCNWISIRLLNGTWKDYLLSTIAARSLIFIRNFAFYSAVFSSKLTWLRTDKFKAFSSGARAFSSCKQEIMGAVTYIIFTCLLFPFVDFRQLDIIFLIWLGIVNQLVSFLCAPILAYISEKYLNSE
jgi:cellulose synthase/poly-beta-1,6-N-acetylglucosamine synthase-like glycosyltransferase